MSQPDPIPHMRPPRGFALPDLTNYTHVWRYEDECGDLLCFVVRFIGNDGKKMVLPLSWCTMPDGSEQWAFKGPPDQRKHIYKAKEIEDRPAAPIVICEGEKAADAAQVMLPHCVCIAWMGGANCANKPDWSCLGARDVILWPDMDNRAETPKAKQAGWKAMMDIAGMVREKVQSIHILDYTPGEKEGGWDAADGLDEGLNAAEFLEQRKVSLTPSEDPNEFDFDIITAQANLREEGRLDSFSAQDFPAVTLESKAPEDVSKAVLKTLAHLNIARYRGEWAVFNGASYMAISEEWLGAQITRIMERFTVVKCDKNGDPTDKIVRFAPKKSTTAEVLHSLLARHGVILGDSLDAPLWRLQHAEHNAIDCIAVGNGVYDTRKMKFLGKRPDLFLLGNAQFDYSDTPPPPAAWLEFLGTIFEADPTAILTLQEWMGYQLTHDYSHHKSLYIVGPRRAGKGTIASIMTALVGRSCARAITIEQLSSQFGIQKLIGGVRTAIVADARFNGRNTNDATPIILSITSNDDVSIERKYLQDWTGRLGSKLTVMSNDMPSMRDDSGALSGRFIFVKLERTFYGQEDLGLTARLLEDMPGIFLWAIDGLQRLRKQGRFTLPAAHQEAQDEAHESASPVVAFLAQCCRKQNGTEYEEFEFCADLYKHFLEFCAAEGIKNIPASRSFGRSLMSTWSHIERHKRQALGHDRQWAYVGMVFLALE